MCEIQEDKGALRKLFAGNMVFAGTIFCVERHQRSKVGYLSCATKACEWGQERDNASTCGDCCFGVKLQEFKPAYDPREVINEEKKKDPISIEEKSKEIVVMYQ